MFTALLTGIAEPSPAGGSGRGHLRTGVGILLLLGALGGITALMAAWAPAALAGTATLQPQANSGMKLTYEAGPGERNKLSLYPVRSETAPVAYYSIWDDAGISPGVGCEQTDEPGHVRCPVAGGVAATAAMILLGDRSDTVEASAIAETRPTIRGGTGNDKISSASGILDGGSGRDVLEDLESGDERASIGARFIGGPGADSIYATDGPDRIDPGSGEDWVEGFGGRDVIRVRDAEYDYVQCGARAKLVVADALDYIGGQCRRVRRNGPTRAALLEVETNGDASSFTLLLTIGCPADGPRLCSGAVTISITGGRRLAKRRFRIPRGEYGWPTTSLELNKRGLARALERRGVRVTLWSRDRSGRAYTLTKHMAVPFPTTEESDGD